MSLRPDAAGAHGRDDSDVIQYGPVPPGTNFFGRFGQTGPGAPSTAVGANKHQEASPDNEGIKWCPVTSAGITDFWSRFRRS